jgi:hypothetical protein
MTTPSKNTIQCPCGKVFSADKSAKRIYCSRKCYGLAKVIPVELRFWKNVKKTEGCWLWTGASTFGYGTISKDGSQRKATRVSWEIFYGYDPVGKHLLHKCDTPACVRPDHLFLGNDRDNHRDRAIKGRGNARVIEAFGEKKPMCLWLDDPRCAVTRNALSKRLDSGIIPEDAITTPMLPRSERRRGL